MSKPAIVVLISGKGSNLQAIIDAIKTQRLSVEIKAVICDCHDAYGLQRAKQNEIKTIVITKAAYPKREAYDEALIKQIDLHQPQLIGVRK